ncbi:sigma-70 family RNA polymerase sigma factor [Nocardioides sp.]|uniref:sigma-70 family RNA polymerase sigma factor n=1 Tax=Nocardioides sp. TaxID=35761 RepID=UPI002B271FC6|nr:sigma-70 family RNA polymerase sigma factor [Nocardioides sp.]
MTNASEEPIGLPDERAVGAPSGLAVALRRCAAGDQDAFAEVYDATSARAFGLALRVLRDRAQAEDAVQEAYLQVWKQSARYDGDRGSAISWILMIVHGTAVSQVRSSQSRSNREEVYERQADPLRVGREDPTSAAADASMDADRVREALGQLTELQRSAIELAYFEGRTHTEVAGIIGIPLGTAKTRIRDGLLRLRDVMAIAG